MGESRKFHHQHISQRVQRAGPVFLWKHIANCDSPPPPPPPLDPPWQILKKKYDLPDRALVHVSTVGNAEGQTENTSATVSWIEFLHNLTTNGTFHKWLRCMQFFELDLFKNITSNRQSTNAYSVFCKDRETEFTCFSEVQTPCPPSGSAMIDFGLEIWPSRQGWPQMVHTTNGFDVCSSLN